ncbi:chemotaxis protein CheB [Noviherbaspirillum saxi]|uniref:protein-glutamate methylesterase n=1 Tax=Noviherbaspirillum saxi TaxID=2320863 RepID=A0A3A3FKX2_9BURK|nr:chemotaxis protein CheB [Noviherbaspirillum saxi]RJF95115.1 chemotaxis protein CheB [Noviherbaspirillum saxi]
MAAHSRIVVIGASAGGLDALRRLLGRLPVNFPAPILVVLHIGSHYSVLPKILENDISLPVRHAEDNEPLVPGVVLFAPPDRHLLLEDGMVHLSKGAKENFSRPAIDPLFRSAAVFYRENAIGIILTGFLDDGTIGLQAIKAYGGVALVQNPDEADEPSMPRSALDHVDVDACLSLEGLADRLLEIVETEPEAAVPSASWHLIETEGRFDRRQKSSMEELDRIGVPSGFTCPECQGLLWEINEASPGHFRCHTGHVFTEQGLNTAQDSLIEEAVWAAVRALHEKQKLLQRLAKAVGIADRHDAAREHVAAANSLAEHAEILRKLVTQR